MDISLLRFIAVIIFQYSNLGCAPGELVRSSYNIWKKETEIVKSFRYATKLLYRNRSCSGFARAGLNGTVFYIIPPAYIIMIAFPYFISIIGFTYSHISKVYHGDSYTCTKYSDAIINCCCY